jgi:outer membrane lipoprotein LolB
MRVWLAAALLSLLAGCASLPAPPPAERIYGGRFAATAQVDGRTESSSGRFTLYVGRGRITLDLASPLGNTLARLELGPDGARMQAPRADGTLTEARGASGAELAEQLLGYPLPVEGLADWVDARPVPGRPAQVDLVAGRTQSIVQDGWTIRVLDRFDQGDPRRLSFDRAADGSGAAVSLRLVFDAPAAEPSQ